MLALLVLAVAGLTAGGVGLSLYDEATRPDRSTPAVVVHQFLQSAFTDHDTDRVALFVCRGWPAGEALSEVSPPTDPEVRVTWGDLTTTTSAPGVEVRARMEFTVAGPAVVQRQVEFWRFGLMEQDGWRVCSLTRDNSLNP